LQLLLAQACLWQEKPDAPANTQIFDTLKMKGKMIDPGNMPAAVREAFGLLP
jgi:hypothetical protein